MKNINSNHIKGQVMVEYIVVCTLVAMVLIMPVDGRPVYGLVIDGLRAMHVGYMKGMSTYAYPF